MDKTKQTISSQDADPIDISCTCGWQGVALVPDLRRDYYALCKACGKKIYGVNCPKCQTGYAYPEDDKDINKERMTWKCCGEISLSNDAQNNFCESYNSEKELPEEMRQIVQERERKMLPFRLTVLLISLAVMIFFAWISFKSR